MQVQTDETDVDQGTDNLDHKKRRGRSPKHKANTEKNYLNWNMDQLWQSQL